MAHPGDFINCSYCGIREHIHLLDGVITPAGRDTGKLACIKCYPKATRSARNPGSTWCPLSVAHFSLSVAPSLRPLYDAWKARGASHSINHG